MTRPVRQAHPRVLAGVCLALLFVVSGCSSAPVETDGRPALGDLPTIRDYEDIVLPLEAYTSSITDRAIMETAREELTAACMEQFGYIGYPVTDWTYLTREPKYGNTYGIVSQDQARTSGFTPDWILESERASAKALERFADWPGGAELTGGTPDSAPLQDAETPSASGGILEGGCIGEGRRDLFALADAAPPSDVYWLTNLEGRAFAQASEDPRMVPVTDAFASCARSRGYDYAEPSDAGEDDRWNAVDSAGNATQAERDAAMAVVDCKQESRWIDTLVALVATYQDRIIEENAEALSREREIRRAILAAIREQGLGTLGGREGGTPPD